MNARTRRDATPTPPAVTPLVVLPVPAMLATQVMDRRAATSTNALRTRAQQTRPA